MILIDFLSRLNTDDNDPYEIMPISFNLQKVLFARYCVIYMKQKKKDIKYQ